MRLFRLRSSLRAHAEVEQYRAAAKALRESDPSLYSQILAQAMGSEAEAAARADPDAFVALFLAKAEEVGVIGGNSEDDEPGASDRVYRPDLASVPSQDTSADTAVRQVADLAQAERNAPILYCYVSRLVTAGFVEPLIRYLNTNDEGELRVLAMVHLSHEDIEQLERVSTAVALAHLQHSSAASHDAARLALALARVLIREDETDLLAMDPTDPDHDWSKVFMGLLIANFSLPTSTLAPEMTPEMQRAGNTSMLSLYTFPQLTRVVATCITGSVSPPIPARKPIRDPGDYYDAVVSWPVDVSAVEPPETIAEARSRLSAGQLALLDRAGLDEPAPEEPASPDVSSAAVPPRAEPLATPTEDVGLEVVNAIAEMMSIDAEWSTRDARGFAWWGKDHAQRVWSEPGYDDDGIEIFRLHARTPIVRDFEASAENLGKLNALSMLTTTSAFLVNAEERTVELAASMYLHAETADWVLRWFGQVVAMQAADAQIRAPLLARVTDSSPATSAHPASGQRDEPDDMLNVLEQVVVPRGEDPSAWQGDDMRKVVEIIRGIQQTVMANGDGDGLTAEFPFQSRTSLLTLTSEARNPQLGNGVLSLLRLPVSFDEEDGIRFAHDLNRRELTSLTRSHFLGSWCWQDDTLHFVTFLPNALYLGGADLLNFTFSCAQRARWVAETIYGDDWGANLDASGRPLATPAMQDLMETITRARPEDGERPARVEETLDADDTPERKVLMDEVEAELPSDNGELDPP